MKIQQFAAILLVASAIYLAVVSNAQAISVPSFSSWTTSAVSGATSAISGGATGEAIGRSFGGHITLFFPVCWGGGIWTQVAPVGGSPPYPFYLWTPATDTRMAGPPHVPRGGILGVFGPPSICLSLIHFPGSIPISVKPTIYYGSAPSMTLIGTSALPDIEGIAGGDPASVFKDVAGAGLGGALSI